MTIPSEIEHAPEPLGDLARRLVDAERTARAARAEAKTYERKIYDAEKADVRAAAEAAADEKPAPRPTAPKIKTAAKEADTAAEVSTATYQLLAGRLAAEIISGEGGKAWQADLDAQHATAVDVLHDRLSATVEAVAHLVTIRRTRAWITTTTTNWPRFGAFPGQGVPNTSVPIGGNAIDVTRLLEAVAQWADPPTYEQIAAG